MKELLVRIVSNPQIEASWLHTLSLLEYIGARKISRTVCESHPSLEVLRHFYHETRHAYVFKKLAYEVSGSKNVGYLSHDEAVSYFQMLDTMVTEWLTALTGVKDPYQNYLFVTSLIERRAMLLYPLYKKVTPHQKVKEELEKIILEEASHRMTIERHAKQIIKKYLHGSRNPCRKIEEDLYAIFVSCLQKEVDHSPPKRGIPVTKGVAAGLARSV